MSHVVTCKVALTDLEAVKAAAARLGLEFIQGQKTYRWYGKSVGDYPLPKGFTTEELGHCEHALRVKGASDRAYEAGLVRRKDGKGWTLIYDFWGANRAGIEGGPMAQALGGPEMNTFAQTYSVCAMERTAKLNGWATQEERQPDGRVKLVVWR